MKAIILFLMQMTDGNAFDVASEPLGVLIFAALLIGAAVALRRFLKWNEAVAEKTRNLPQELLEKTVS